MFGRMLTGDTTNQPAPGPADIRRRLATLREALLHLHKALLDAERASYEAAFGTISSPYQLLNLVTNDPWFAWLAPITQLVAQVDEALDSKEPLTASFVDAIIKQCGALLVASPDGEGFSRHYDEALQRSPDVIMAHAVAARIIRGKN